MSANYRFISHTYCSPSAFISDSHPSPISEYSSSSSSSSSSYAYQQPSPINSSDSDSSQHAFPSFTSSAPRAPRATSVSAAGPYTYSELSQFPAPPSETSPFTYQNLDLGFTGSELPSSTRTSTASSRFQVAHPYARLVAKKDDKRRKIWNHALEKSLFTPYEISTLGAPHRRKMYIGSLEAHIDTLHAQLLEIGFYPVPFPELEPFRGLNSKTAKSMVAGLQHDASVSKLKLLELERSNHDLECTLGTP